jgi:hypothetical protein
MAGKDKLRRQVVLALERLSPIVENFRASEVSHVLEKEKPEALTDKMQFLRGLVANERADNAQQLLEAFKELAEGTSTIKLPESLSTLNAQVPSYQSQMCWLLADKATEVLITGVVGGFAGFQANKYAKTGNGGHQSCECAFGWGCPSALQIQRFRLIARSRRGCQQRPLEFDREYGQLARDPCVSQSHCENP